MAPKTQVLKPKPTAAGGAGDQPSDAVGQASRAAALELLAAGLTRRSGFDEALGKPPFSRLPTRDRAFARALAATTLRRLGPLDALLTPRLQRAPPVLVMNLLRLGLAQLLYMETPAHAAVSTMVEEAAARKESRPFKGLINAVLRGLGRDLAKAPFPDAPPQAYAPEWLFNRWRAAYGDAVALAIAGRIKEEPETDLSLRDPADAPALAEALEAAILPGGSLRTTRRGDLTDWPDFDRGRWWVQDAAAAIPARLLAVKLGETVLDMCAAPGGKTLQLAAMGATVTALDRSAPRLVRVSENLARIGLSAEIVTADGVSWSDARTFDAILLDAPCSATGTFRRHPDVLWAARPGDLAQLCALQARLLDAAAGRLRPGGRLVYCVCSLEPEEGEAQARAILQRNSKLRLDPIQPAEGGAPEGSITPDGMLRIHPGLPIPEGGMDGFFAARFVREEA